MADPTIKRGPSSELPALGYDPTTTHAMVPLQVVSVVQDPVSGQWYGVLNVNASFSASSLSINDPNTTTQKASVDASGNLQVKLGSALPSGANVIGHVVVDSGSITANAGTNLNTSALALESGGNLATVATNTSNTATGVGGVADSAYASGSGSIIAILKGIFGRIGATLGFDNTNVLKISNYGKNSAAGDTAILVDSTGRTLIGRSTVALFTLASTATSGSTQNSSDLTVSPYTEIGIDITTTAQSGTNPTIQYFYERKGADGLYYPLWQSAVFTAASNTLSTSIGVGMAYNQSLGLTGRLRWVIGGSATPTYTHQINMYAK